jgi:threonine synthase
MEQFPLGKINKNEFKKFIDTAYSSFIDKKIIPLLKINEYQYLMEEYYGPTASFKDLALQLFPIIFEKAISEKNEKFLILVATSGDTGSAVLDGFKNTDIPVIILYPIVNVSKIQQLQMTISEGNVYVLGVKGDFDFCQRAIKSIFNDTEFINSIKKEYNLYLTSANSINWGRLFPQICYTINSYLELVKVIIILLEWNN